MCIRDSYFPATGIPREPGNRLGVDLDDPARLGPVRGLSLIHISICHVGVMRIFVARASVSSGCANWKAMTVSFLAKFQTLTPVSYKHLPISYGCIMGNTHPCYGLGV